MGFTEALFMTHYKTLLRFQQAKKILQEEIDKYIEDQIDKAGQAISSTVQEKISNGDNILTYGW